MLLAWDLLQEPHWAQVSPPGSGHEEVMVASNHVLLTRKSFSTLTLGVEGQLHPNQLGLSWEHVEDFKGQVAESYHVGGMGGCL